VTKADWAGTTLPAMWNSAQAADTQMAWQQVAAWQRTYELLQHHERRLRLCREELTFAWPPERSPAATAFVEYIDGLVVAIERAKGDAAANHRALVGVLSSLSEAKTDMAKLKAEWDKHAAEDANMAAILPNDLFASENWQEALNEKGRVRMAKNDQEVFEATQKMVELTGPFDGRETEPRDPFDVESGQPARQSAGPGVGQANGGSAIGMMPHPVVSVSDVDRGFGLSGSVATLPLNSPVQAAGSASSASGGSLVATHLPPIGNISSPSGSLTRPPASGVGPKRGGVASNPTGRVAFGGQLPVAAAPGSRPSRGSAPTKVKPVGGVIEGGAGTRGVNGMPFGAGGRPGSGVDVAHEPVLTLQWEVPQGVPPVINPEQERPFELGPGVIGLADVPRS